VRNAAASLIGAIYLLALTGCRGSGGETLLFLGRASGTRVGDVSWAPDAARSRLVAFDRRLRVIRTIADPRLASPVAVARFPRDRLLVSERTGEGVVWDTSGRAVREWPSPFPAALYATSDERILASRSPYFVQLIGEDGSAPLLWMLDTLGRPTHGVGITHVPESRYLAQLANAGPVAVAGEAIYFAPLVRDEILRLDLTGSPVWRSSRGLIAEERDPQVTRSGGGGRRVAHALINIAMTIGPDGRLYVLGADDSAATTLRLDVLDAERGQILERRSLGTSATAIAVNRRGEIRVLDPDSLLAQTPTSGREPFGPPFALPDLAGDTVRLSDYQGQVTLVNFWASWCEPCREEFPHMAELHRDLSREGFAIAAISDDVSDRQMRAFVHAFQPPFPILAGGGRMKATYHFRGLPYSVLLDRHGRAVERIFGFGGAAEFQKLRESIARVLREPYP
jgi:thiol-disulfide isomerase/thioredoxin